MRVFLLLILIVLIFISATFIRVSFAGDYDNLMTDGVDEFAYGRYDNLLTEDIDEGSVGRYDNLFTDEVDERLLPGRRGGNSLNLPFETLIRIGESQKRRKY